MKNILSHIHADRPYFKSDAAGTQGNPIRQLYLSKLINSLKGQHIRLMEIGSWIGASALTFGFSMRQFDVSGGILCVDPWLPYFNEADIAQGADYYETMNEMGKSDVAYKLFLHNVRFSPISIQHQRGVSAEILPKLESNSFDVIYIDGSHYYDDVAFDLKESDRILKIGGILCGDDLELQVSDGIDFNFAVANDSRDCLIDPNKKTFYHPGVTLAVNDFFHQPVSAHEGFWLMKKVGEGAYEPFPLDGYQHIIPPHFAQECIE
ncbi:MAG: class I SAM-dependent methyltransferase [Burkholderiales bacterium]|nr:class I SAM-dependent methyltransferase [Burkholderiales bacterium]